MGWVKRIASAARHRQSERNLNDEMQHHIELKTRENIEAGMSPEEARYAALRAFGGVEQKKEACRDADRLRWLGDLIQDVRYGLRQLRRNPGFTAIAVITLALGIGANTAIFSLLDALVLRDLPVSHPEQIVLFGAHTPGDNYASVSLPMFEELARDQRVFFGTFAWQDFILNFETHGQRSRADVWEVTGNFYSELGAIPAVGRLLGPGDVNLGSAIPAQVAVLGYGFWQRNYGGERDVVGKTLKIEGVPFTIIGVTRKAFNAMSADSEAEITIPLTALQKDLQSRNVLWLDAAGRLKAGVTVGQARAELDSLWPAIRQATTPVEQTPAESAIWQSLQMSVEYGATGSSFVRVLLAKSVYILLGISAFVLLLACVNLASLTLARAAARNHEFGVRAALGARGARIGRQVLTESVLLSTAGTVAGFGFANWGSYALAAYMLGQVGFAVPVALNLSPDLRILGFTAAVALFTGVLCGLAPAWRASHEDPNSALQQTSRTVGRGTGKLGRSLVIAQVAISLVLLAGAGLFIRTLEQLRAVQPGFRIGNMLEVRIWPRTNGFKNIDPASYFRALTDRTSHLPGVSAAAVEHGGIGEGFEWTVNVRIHGRTNELITSDCERIMPGFFRTTGISLLRGRTFAWQDDEHAPKVAIVSANFAQRLFPRGNPIGRRIDVTTEPEWRNLEIIGVVGNASLYDIRKPSQPTVYIPTLQYKRRADFDELLVHTKLSSAAMLPALRQVVNSLGRQYVLSVQPLAEAVTRSISQERITAMLSTFFGGLALLLAAIGLYGLMAYNVTRRIHELGIRFALGAQRKNVLRMILRETVALTLAGVTIGVPCALATARLIAHMLFGVTFYDPLSLAAASGALLVVGLVAGYVPARRAARVDPMVALRYE